MKLSEFLTKAIDEAFNDATINAIDQYKDTGDITDRFFCFIQGNRELLGDYLDTVAETREVKVVNSHIAQYLCKKYDLHSGELNPLPYSYLIQGYHKLWRNN